MIENDIDVLAQVLHAAMFRSRRAAVRMLVEAGLSGAGEQELDRLLRFIEEHPRHEEIVRQAQDIEEARLIAQRRAALDAMPPEGDLPEWLIGETPHWGRTFIIHFDPGGAESFVGEIFDDVEQVPEQMETWPLDDGQFLANITWLDGEPPDDERVRELMERARFELRLHDAQSEELP